MELCPKTSTNITIIPISNKTIYNMYKTVLKKTKVYILLKLLIKIIVFLSNLKGTRRQKIIHNKLNRLKKQLLLKILRIIECSCSRWSNNLLNKHKKWEEEIYSRTMYIFKNMIVAKKVLIVEIIIIIVILKLMMSVIPKFQMVYQEA